MRTFIRTILHFIANWFFNSVCLYACTQWLPGMTLYPQENVPLYLLVMELGLALTVMNTMLRPILLLLLLPLNALTVGLLSIFLNGLFIFLLDRFSVSLEISSFWVGLAATFIFALLNMLLQALIPLDDDIIYYSIIGQRRAADNKKTSHSKGIVMLEIDGLSYPRLMAAVESGRMPFLKDLLLSGSFRIQPYDCGIPSQTSSCQAGIMFGRNENICAFRWYDKENRRVYSSSNSQDAADMEAMLFKGEKPSGILNNGMSVNNIISGNASENIFTISRLFPGSREEMNKFNRDMFYFSLRPYLLTKSLLLTFLDAGREVLSYCWDYIRNKKPRLNRLKGFYPIVRGATNILLRDLSTAMIADAVANGKEAVYTTFIGYDEIAHHSGPDSHEAINALGGIDRSIRKIYEAIQITNARHYEMVVLSDHGQSYGATFTQRYGVSLGDYIRILAIQSSLSGDALQVVSVEDDDDNSANVVAVLNALSRKNDNSLIQQTADNIENAINESEKSAIEKAESDANDIIVLASGNLVNAYFKNKESRLTYDEIEENYPGLVTQLTRHPGVGTVSVLTAEGPVVFSENGQRNLKTGEVTGTDPLIIYGTPELRAEQLACLMGYPNVGDLVIISPVYEDGTVAAYEELIGSHGGFGGQQTEPFLMYSSDMKIPETIENSREVYPVLTQIKNSPVYHAAAEKDVDTTSFKALLRQIADIRSWIFVLAKTLFFSPSAYQEIAENESLNGPACLIGLITFISTWTVMNRLFYSGTRSLFVNFTVLVLVYGIEFLAAYLAVIIFRGRRKPRRLARTVFFTKYFGLLWLFLLTGQANAVWALSVLLLCVTALATSVIFAGKLKRIYGLPIFVILVILIPGLTFGLLLIFNFFRFFSAQVK